MPLAGTEFILAGLPVSDLEEIIIWEQRSVTRCRLAKAIAEAELHGEWRDLVLDEWARRREAATQLQTVY